MNLLNDYTQHDFKRIQILNLIAEHPSLSQREMARHTGLSLGLVNLILQRLLKTGHIKISNLSKKKVRYWLTARGFKEKANQSCEYLVKTVSIFMDYKQRMDGIVRDITRQGHRHVAILGQGEISELLEYSIRTQSEPLHYRFVDEQTNVEDGELLIDCRLSGKPISPTGVRMLSALLEKAPRGETRARAIA